MRRLKLGQRVRNTMQSATGKVTNKMRELTGLQQRRGGNNNKPALQIIPPSRSGENLPVITSNDTGLLSPQGADTSHSTSQSDSPQSDSSIRKLWNKFKDLRSGSQENSGKSSPVKGAVASTSTTPPQKTTTNTRPQTPKIVHLMPQNATVKGGTDAKELLNAIRKNTSVIQGVNSQLTPQQIMEKILETLPMINSLNTINKGKLEVRHESLIETFYKNASSVLKNLKIREHSLDPSQAFNPLSSLNDNDTAVIKDLLQKLDALEPFSKDISSDNKNAFESLLPKKVTPQELKDIRSTLEAEPKEQRYSAVPPQALEAIKADQKGHRQSTINDIDAH